MWEVREAMHAVKVATLESRIDPEMPKRSLDAILPKKKKSKKPAFGRFKNVVLETYERSKLWHHMTEPAYIPPVIEAYADKEYKSATPLEPKEEKSFTPEKLAAIQKEGKLDNLHLSPWKINERAFPVKLQHYDAYELWKLFTPAGQLLAFIAYELA